MKRITLYKTILLTGVIALGIGAERFWFSDTDINAASDATPGSAEDPVVTKSYVDQKLAALGPSKPNPDDSSAGQGEDAAEEVGVVNVKTGQILLGKAGAQFVVRAGKAVAYSTDTNGIADITSGKDVGNGLPTPNNHLLLFPRNGRGITNDPSYTGTVIVMVIGGYEIKNAPAS